MPRRAVSLADRLIVRALSLAMEATGQGTAIAHRLRAEARGNQIALDLAVMRMRRALHVRPSPVGERALAALLEALALTESPIGTNGTGPPGDGVR